MPADGPMLAKEYSKERAKVRFPVLVQPKLDGMRMLYNSRTGKARARSGKSGKTGAQEALLRELGKANWQGYTLDGELYKHGSSFQDVMRAVKSGGLKYYVYDIVSPSPIKFVERYAIFTQLYHAAPAAVQAIVKLVPTQWCNSHEEVLAAQQRFVAEGYEGAIVRDSQAPYVHARTSALLKVKSFEDAEFKVVGFKPHAGGGVVWECETERGQRFWAAPTAELKKEVGARPQAFVGKWLTIKFFGRSENGVPRHPNAKAFRLSSDLAPRKRATHTSRSPRRKSPVSPCMKQYIDLDEDAGTWKTASEEVLEIARDFCKHSAADLDTPQKPRAAKTPKRSPKRLRSPIRSPKRSPRRARRK